MAVKKSHEALSGGKYNLQYDTRHYTVPGLGKFLVQRDEAGTFAYDLDGNPQSMPPLITTWLTLNPMQAPKVI